MSSNNEYIDPATVTIDRREEPIDPATVTIDPIGTAQQPAERIFSPSKADWKALEQSFSTNDPLAFVADPAIKASLVDSTSRMSAPETARRRLALAAYFAQMRRGDIAFCHLNLENVMKAFYGKETTVDEAYRDIASIFAGRQDAGLSRAGGAVVYGTGKVAESVFNLGRLAAMLMTADTKAQLLASGNPDAARLIRDPEEAGQMVKKVYDKNYKPITDWGEEAMQLPDDWMTSSKSFSDWCANAAIAWLSYFPQLAAQVGLTAATGGVGGIATVYGINAYFQIKDDHPEMSEAQAVVYAVGIGLINGLGEKVTLGIINGKVTRDFVKNGIKKGLIDAAKYFGWASLKEGAEEGFVEQIPENILDIVMGLRGDRTNWKASDYAREIFRGVPEAYFLGLSTGGPFAFDPYWSGRRTARQIAEQQANLRNTVQAGLAELTSKSELSPEESRDLELLERLDDAGNINDAIAILREEHAKNQAREKTETEQPAPPDDLQQAARVEQLRERLPHNPADTIDAVHAIAPNFQTPVVTVDAWSDSELAPLVARQIARYEAELGRTLTDEEKNAVKNSVAAGTEAIWTSDGVKVNVNVVPPSRVPFVLNHEIAVHEGLERAFGKEVKNQLLDAVWEDCEESPLMQDILRRYGLQQLDQDGNPVPLNDAQRREAAEEFLANLGETNGVPIRDIHREHRDEIDAWARQHGFDPADLSTRNRQAIVQGWMYDTNFRPERPGWLKQLIARVRIWLRQHGIMVQHLSDDDIQSILARAARAEAGKRGTRDGGSGDGRYTLENAVPSKDGYRVERVNENAGRMLNEASGVICEKVNQVFDPDEAPREGFKGWVAQKVRAFEAEHPITGHYPTPALNADVEITTSSIRSIGNHNGPDAKFNLLPVVPDLLKKAVLIQTETFHRGEGVTSRSHLLAAKVRYGQNDRYIAVMVIHESNGKFYYDHSLLVLKEGELGKNTKAEIEKRNPAKTAGSYSHSAQVLNVARNALLSSGFDTKSEKNTKFSVGNTGNTGNTDGSNGANGTDTEAWASFHDAMLQAVKQQRDLLYERAVAENPDYARDMLARAARRRGYAGDRETSFRDGHGAPGDWGFDFEHSTVEEYLDEGCDTNLARIVEGYNPQPDDYFDDPRGYGYADREGLEAQRNLKQTMQKLRAGDANATITVYRAVPNNVHASRMQNGDWVSPSRSYAVNHGESRFGEGEYRIVEETIPAKFLWWDGNDIREWGYDSGGEDFVANAVGNRKLAEITYDDNGKLIPLSKRFDPQNPDIRYSVRHVWTGSAADYDQPSLHYVGTGEGAQVYGWGLYGSSSKNVARWYAEADADRKNQPKVFFDGKEQDRDWMAKADPDSYDPAELEYEMVNTILDDLRKARGDFDKLLYHYESKKWNAEDLNSPEDAKWYQDAIDYIGKNRERFEYVPSFEEEAVFFNGRMIEYDNRPELEQDRLLQDIRRAVISSKGDIDRVVSAFRSIAAEHAEKAAVLKQQFGHEEAAEYALKEQKHWTRTADFLENHKDEFEYRVQERPKNRNLYDQTFWPDRQENLLDWDQKVPERQMDQIREALEQTGNGYMASALNPDGSGEIIYQQLVTALGSPKAASEFLCYRANIDGITYIGDSSGVRNYVAFDDRDIQVDEHIRFATREPRSERVANLLKLIKPFLAENSGMSAPEIADALRERFGVEVDPDEAVMLKLEAERDRKADRMRKEWHDAYDYFSQAYPLFRFLVEEAGGTDFVVKPSKTFQGEEFSGSFIAPEFKRKKRDPKREQAAAGRNSDELAEAYSRRHGGDPHAIEQEIIDLLRELKKSDIMAEYRDFKRESFANSQAEEQAILDSFYEEERRKIEDEVVAILEHGEGISEEWAGANQATFRELYRELLHAEPPKTADEASVAAVNAAIAGNAFDAESFRTGFEAARREFRERLRGEISDFRNQVREGRDLALKLQSDAATFIAKNLPPEERGRFTGKLLNLMKINDPQKRLDAFDSLLAAIARRSREIAADKLRDKLRTRLDQLGRRADTGRKAVGVRDEESQALIDRIRSIAQMSRIDILEETESLESQLESAREAGRSTETIEENILLLDLFGDLDGQNIDTLRSAAKHLEAVAREGKQRLFRAIHERALADGARRADLIDLMKKEHGATPSEFEIQHRKNERMNRSGLARILDDFATGTLNLWGLFDRMNYSNTGTLADNAFNHFAQITHIAARSRDTANLRNQKDCLAALDRIFGTRGSFDRAAKVRELRKVAAKTGVFRLYPDPDSPQRFHQEFITVEEAEKLLAQYDNAVKAELAPPIPDYQAEAIRHQLRDRERRVKRDLNQLYDKVSDELLKQAVREQQEVFGAARDQDRIAILSPAWDGASREMELSQTQGLYLWLCYQQPDVRYKMHFNGFSEESFRQLEDFLAPEVLEFGRWMRRELDTDRTAIDRVYRKLYFTAFPTEENYFPTYYGSKKGSISGKDVDLGKEGEGNRATAYTPGALKLRVFHLAMPEICDALTLFQNHRLQMNHFVSHAEAARELRAVFTHPDTKREITYRFGDKLYKRLMTQIGDFIQGGRVDAETNTIFQAIFNNTSRAIMTFNLASGVKQAFGSITYGQEIPAWALTRGIAYAWSHPRTVYRILGQSDYFKNRWETGFNTAMRGLLDPSGRKAGKWNEFVKNIDAIGGIFLRSGDAVSVLTGGWAVYSYTKHKLIREGMAPEEAHQRALLEWEMATERTQQSSQTHMLTPEQKSGWRILMPFKSNQILMYQKYAASIAKGDWKSAGKAIGALAVTSLAMTSISQLTLHGGRWDEWSLADYLYDILSDIFSGGGVAGNLSCQVLGNSAVLLDEAGRITGNDDLRKWGKNLYKQNSHAGELLPARSIRNAALGTARLLRPDSGSVPQKLKDISAIGSAIAMFFPPAAGPSAILREGVRLYRAFAGPDEKPKKAKKKKKTWRSTGTRAKRGRGKVER